MIEASNTPVDAIFLSKSAILVTTAGSPDAHKHVAAELGLGVGSLNRREKPAYL